MNIFKRFFNPSYSQTQPDVRFGRYSDIYKNKEQDKAYSDAEKAFEDGQYLDTCRYFLQYLRDEEQNNVQWSENNGQLEFEIIQGSRRVFGKITKDMVSAHTFLARADVNNIGFLRKLIEQNYSLKYSRYALDDNNCITMITDSYLVDASPMKLYHSLRELAIMSDRLDDLLLDEFKNLEQVGELTFTSLADEEKEVKYNYFIKSIEDACTLIDSESSEPSTFSSGHAFLLLQLLFKLDYLLRPEGYVMEELALLYAQYFSKDGKNTERKVMDLKLGFLRLSKRSKEDFFKELYRTDSTFGFSKPADHNIVTQEIDKLLSNMQWYRENNHEQLALAVPSYIVGYSLYNFALTKPDLDFFHLYYQIMEIDFFRDLGFVLPFRKSNNTLNKRSILKAILSIGSNHKGKYSKLRPNLNLLDFTSDVHFSQSYLEMIRNLNLDTGLA